MSENPRIRAGVEAAHPDPANQPPFVTAQQIREAAEALPGGDGWRLEDVIMRCTTLLLMGYRLRRGDWDTQTLSVDAAPSFRLRYHRYPGCAITWPYSITLQDFMRSDWILIAPEML